MSEKKKVSFSWAFKEFIWPRRKIISVGLILIIIKSLAGLVMPYVTQDLVDDVFPQIGDVSPQKDMSKLYTLVSYLGGAIFIQALTSFILTRLLSVEAQLLISKLSAQVQKKLLKLRGKHCNPHKLQL